MNNEELQQLKALAQAATAGPWGCFANEEDGDITSHDVIAINSGVHIASEEHLPSEETAKYIAAASPDVVLALIARIESLAAEMEAVLEAAEEWARYVEVDTAPMQLIIYLQLARDAAIAKEKA